MDRVAGAAGTQSAGFGPYFLVLAGICVSVFLVTKLLAWLNRAYARVSGEEEVVRVRPPWHRSMRGEDDSRPPRSVLDVVMVISVSIAVTIFGIWFFFFAGSSLPRSWPCSGAPASSASSACS